jgi:hypothetical protein
MDEILDVLAGVLSLLDEGLNVLEVEKHTRELKHEGEGVYRISQSSKRVTAGRAYIYFKTQPDKKLVILDIADKPNKKGQNEDIKRAKRSKKDHE